MLAALERERVVGKFVAAYVAEYGRRGILGGPSRDRELAETIGREVMLAMILEVRQKLPRFFGKKRLRGNSAKRKASHGRFFQELMAALGRAWNWKPRGSAPVPARLRFVFRIRSAPGCGEERAQAGKGAAEEDPPFVGRVALLLDPSMLDQARRAARKFYGDIGRLAQKLLRQTLRPGRM